jgi:uncharacterized lipoprotein YmbA
MRALVMLCTLLLAASASAQVTVQEYKLPPGRGAHDVWAASIRRPGRSTRSRSAAAHRRTA